MDSFEINKIIAAVLLTALIIIGIGKAADLVFHVDKPKQSAYKMDGLEVAEVTKESDGKSENVEAVDIAQHLAVGNLARGEKIIKKCGACKMIASD